MSQTEILKALEAILIVADDPVAPKTLAELLEISTKEAESLCDDLSRQYKEENRGFILALVAGGYRFQSHPDFEKYVESFVIRGAAARLSAAALETLAIVAYKQPISRAQVGEIRNVNSDAVMRTLTLRGLIEEISGKNHPALFGTTAEFLERLGINNLESLPHLAEFVPPIEIAESLEAELRSAARVGHLDRKAENPKTSSTQTSLDNRIDIDEPESATELSQSRYEYEDDPESTNGHSSINGQI